MVAVYSTFVQSFLLLLVTLILVVFPADGLLGRGNLDTSYIDEERTLYIVSVFERDTARHLVYESLKWKCCSAHTCKLNCVLYKLLRMESEELRNYLSLKVFLVSNIWCKLWWTSGISFYICWSLGCLCCFYNKPDIKALNRVGLHHLNFCSLFSCFQVRLLSTSESFPNLQCQIEHKYGLFKHGP